MHSPMYLLCKNLNLLLTKSAVLLSVDYHIMLCNLIYDADWLIQV